MVHWLICIAVLVPLCFGMNAYAVDVVVDGDIRARTEYKETGCILQNVLRESYCNLSNAYLYWQADPANNAVYLAVLYESSDMSKKTDITKEEMAQEVCETGIELTINGKYCGMIRVDQQSMETADTGFLADGYSTDMDQNRFTLAKCKWFLVTGPTSNSQCEMHVGLKYWEGETLDIGIRIFDYSGNTSNYHTVRVYEKPEETTASTTHAQEETEKETKEKTTKEKTTKETTTTTTTTKTTTTVTTTAVQTKQAKPTQAETKPEKKTEPLHERAALTGVSRAATTMSVSDTSAATAERTKKKTAPKKKVTQTRQTDVTESSVTDLQTSARSETEMSVKESALQSSESDSVYETVYALTTRLSGIQNRGKLIGVAAAASLLTGAVMFSVFSIGRSSAPKRDDAKENSHGEDSSKEEK